MSLEDFNEEKVKTFFEIADYKHLPKLLLAIDELNRASSLADIENIFVDHRQKARYSSLTKTIKRAKKMKLIEGDNQYSLTNYGKENVEFLKKLLPLLKKL